MSTTAFGYRFALTIMLVVAALCIALYTSLGEVKPFNVWKWVDIASEGGIALMSAVWSLIILSSRPSGRVTALLAGGLSAIAFGSWVDCLDEFIAIPHSHYWDNWLESLPILSGVLALTAGLYLWRQEQFSLNEHMQKRERLFRDHRSFDRITQLANADYLRRQIHLEQESNPNKPCALILLDVNQFHLINRQYGQREGDRLLQAISHLLLLNMHPNDLLCRYAGDRFAILMPSTDQIKASQTARHLEKVVNLLAHHTRQADERILVSVRIACAVADEDPDMLLQELNAALEPTPPKTDNVALFN
jgi:diguanylate cyclase (GGDEF)-like protein